jgi:hypothetical protein
VLKLTHFFAVSVYALISRNVLIMDNEGYMYSSPQEMLETQIQFWVLVPIYNLEAEWGKELSQTFFFSIVFFKIYESYNSCICYKHST